VTARMYYAIAIAALGFLIIVHESGHYVVARWCKMRVDTFSIGFGPGLLKRKSRSGTTFQLAPIPFGGYVAIAGMNIAEEVEPDDELAYPNRPTWQRFATIFAGPATNYISAIVLAFGLYTCHGMRSTQQWWGVDNVLEGFDAQGKLQPGDRILEIDHHPVLASNGDSLTAIVNAKHGAPLTLTVRRAGKSLDVTITPKLSDKDAKDAKPRYLLGIAPDVQADVVHVGVLTAAGAALAYPIDETKQIGRMLWKIVNGQEKADPGGPTRMVEEFRKAFRTGPVRGIQLLMALSVWLGLVNLFPLPALDGGRLVFLGYELVTRRRANPKSEATIHMAGIMVLMVVMVLVTLHDFHWI
jgi:regulator of sigma E protease